MFKRFIKDRAILIAFYLFNIISVITFFHLSERANSEVLYPLTIGLFLLGVYLLIDWFRYYQVNRALEKLLCNQYTELHAYTEEQKAFLRLLNKKNQEHSKDKNEQKEKNKERLYFLSHWMHYLKTPVSVIELMIQKEKQNEVRPTILEKIQAENKRLHTSIEQGLTMIRMDRFENDLEVQAVDLITSLRKLINNRKVEFIYQSVFPVIKSEREHALVITDSKWNEVMLEQIISNAVKYSTVEDESKKLRFQVRLEGDETALSIIDEGVGIPPHDLERVFEPFFTGENGRKFSNSSGIGLYLCKRISDKLGHHLLIHSEVSKGTTVTIRYLTKL
ncbi:MULTISPECIES: sensor histidine kinase [Bacillus]|uniref:sensor histidine kinase n=1 Tax=Bacillus TaxID=1386 RepID=UPI000BB84B48|nr:MULTISPECIES: sensor histidine kinase [Bacillus]